MRLILLGPPGSGKGTQAKLLATHYGLLHIATGDILRDAIRRNTPAGARARTFVESGQLAPDVLVNDLVRELFAQATPPTRFVMDGYPRTRAQAVTFNEILEQYNLPLARVVLLKVPDDEIVRRADGRRVCPNPECKAVYHLETNPPKVPGVCDLCHSELVKRKDDEPETVRARLKVYHRDTEELIPFYRNLGLLSDVSGTGSIEKVHLAIKGTLVPQAGQPC